MYTNLAVNEVVSESKAVKHNHLSNFKSQEIRKVKERIKTAAIHTEEAMTQIIQALPELSYEALQYAPSQEAMARLIQQRCYRKSDRREEAESFFELQLQDGVKFTTDNDNSMFSLSASTFDDHQLQAKVNIL